MKSVLFAGILCALPVFAQEKSAYQIAQEAAWKKHPTLALGATAPDFNLAPNFHLAMGPTCRIVWSTPLPICEASACGG